MIFDLLAPKIYLIILASQSFDYERSWWNLFQKPWSIHFEFVQITKAINCWLCSVNNSRLDGLSNKNPRRLQKSSTFTEDSLFKKMMTRQKIKTFLLKGQWVILSLSESSFTHIINNAKYIRWQHVISRYIGWQHVISLYIGWQHVISLYIRWQHVISRFTCNIHNHTWHTHKQAITNMAWVK
jgi:hypothetical protein